MKSLKLDPFLTGLIAMVVLAYYLPYSPSTASIFPLKDLIYFGIMGIFLLYGIKLNPREIVADLKNWKLHLLIQATTFLIFPLVVLLFYPLFINSVHYNLWLGSFFLAALPSTVSSSVVMVAIGKGNLSSAIFNASISGLIGLILTPFYMHPFLPQSGSDIPMTNIAAQLMLQVLFPIILGLFLHKSLSPLVKKHSSKVAWFDKIIIFLIVYKSFSTAFLDGVFTQLSLWMFIAFSATIVLLFFFIYHLILKLTKRMNFLLEDQITALFCGSKKSLVHGSVFVIVLVNDLALQSILLLPVMIYHGFQLFFVSYKASQFAKR